MVYCECEREVFCVCVFMFYGHFVQMSSVPEQNTVWPQQPCESVNEQEITAD